MAVHKMLMCLMWGWTFWCGSTPAQADDARAWQALRSGGIVLLRHANAPGYGDPPGFQHGDCSTQRNLDEAGRAQAKRIGETFRAQRVKVGAVYTSRWCRARDTATLAFDAQLLRENPAFDSLFNDSNNIAARTDAAKAALLNWQGPGALVVTSHQANIVALTDVHPAAGEGVVLRRGAAGLEVVGRIRPW